MTTVTSSLTRFEVPYDGKVFNVEVNISGPRIPYGMVDHLINVVSQNLGTFDGSSSRISTGAAIASSRQPQQDGESWGEEEVPEEVVAEVVAEVVGEAELEQPSEDVYASFTKLKDLVLYLQSLGYTEFQSIFAACTELIQGDLCPMLTKISNLEGRLKTTCTVNGIPV